MKFRGKRTDNGEWVEGDIHWGKYYRTAHIHPALGSNFSDNIYPDSVSMSTGQKDKNGVEIFGSIPIDGKISKGGDIVKLKDFTMRVEYKSPQFILRNEYAGIIGLDYCWNCLEVTGNQYEED